MEYTNFVSDSFVSGTTGVSGSFTNSSGIDWNSVTPTYDASLGDRFSTPLSLSGTDALGSTSSDTTWTFICTPEEISWTTSNAVNRVDMFGTNNPPAISGTKGLREFNLNNALVEGFTRNKQVEAKVSALEDLLKYKSSLSGGFVNVPVYQVWANQKGYGQQAYFLIKSVQVKETMRDLTGNSTRAYVDVSFVEVPAYQVDSGIDQAPISQQGASGPLNSATTSNTRYQEQLKATTNAYNQNLDAAKKAAAPKPAKPKQ